MEPDTPEIRSELRKLREEKNLTLAVVSKRMGISQSYLCDLELGRRYWDAGRVECFKKALSI